MSNGGNNEDQSTTTETETTTTTTTEAPAPADDKSGDDAQPNPLVDKNA